MSTAILLSTSFSQKLCRKTQSTRRRRRHVHPEDPDHSIGQDRQPTAKRTATLADDDFVGSERSERLSTAKPTTLIQTSIENLSVIR